MPLKEDKELLSQVNMELQNLIKSLVKQYKDIMDIFNYRAELGSKRRKVKKVNRE